MKIYLLIAICLLLPFLLFAECTEEEKARMIKQSISDSVIQKICSEKIDNSTITNANISEQEREIIKQELREVLKEENQESSPGYWREQEIHGIGFGIWLWTHFFYDYNFSDQYQLHTGITSISVTQEDIFGREVLTTTGTLVTSTLRYFPSLESGWFLGGGMGYGSIQQSYAYSELLGIDADSSSDYIPYFMDVGWQGWDGYYFTIDFTLGSSIVINETDNTNNIPATFSNHQSEAKSTFRTIKSATSIGLLFGWYL